MERSTAEAPGQLAQAIARVSVPPSPRRHICFVAWATRDLDHLSSCLRQVPPPCQPSALGGIFSNDDGDDDDGDGDYDDDCDGDDDDDDEKGQEEEEEEGRHMFRFSCQPC